MLKFAIPTGQISLVHSLLKYSTMVHTTNTGLTNIKPWRQPLYSINPIPRMFTSRVNCTTSNKRLVKSLVQNLVKNLVKNLAIRTYSTALSPITPHLNNNLFHGFSIEKSLSNLKLYSSDPLYSSLASPQSIFALSSAPGRAGKIKKIFLCYIIVLCWIASRQEFITLYLLLFILNYTNPLIGVSVVRLSGPMSKLALQIISHPKTTKYDLVSNSISVQTTPLSKLPPKRVMSFRKLFHPLTGEHVDDALVVWFEGKWKKARWMDG